MNSWRTFVCGMAFMLCLDATVDRLGHGQGWLATMYAVFAVFYLVLSVYWGRREEAA